MFFFDQDAFFFQQLHNRFIGLKNLFTLIIRHFGGKLTGFVNRADNREILVIRTAGLKVVLAKARRNMDNAGTVLGGNEFATQNLKRAFVFQMFEIREHRLIAHPNKVFAFDCSDLGSMFELLFITAEQSLSQYIFLTVFFHNGIVNIQPDSQH